MAKPVLSQSAVASFLSSSLVFLVDEQVRVSSALPYTHSVTRRTWMDLSVPRACSSSACCGRQVKNRIYDKSQDEIRGTNSIELSLLPSHTHTPTHTLSLFLSLHLSARGLGAVGLTREYREAKQKKSGRSTDGGGESVPKGEHVSASAEPLNTPTRTRWRFFLVG